MSPTTATIARGVAAATVLGLLLLGSGPASAIPDPGPGARSGSPASYATDCQLERVERQLVRCDDLTGAGATAPSSVPVQ